MIYCVTATVVILEISFAAWLLLKWFHKNININWSPTVNIEESGRRRSDSSIEKKAEVWKEKGPVEVDVDKKFFIDKADKTKIEIDEKIDGKVKTQKEKLKKLRGM